MPTMSELEINKVFQGLGLPTNPPVTPQPAPAPSQAPQPSSQQGGMVYFPISGATAPLKQD